MTEKIVTVKNRSGIHTRPAAAMVKIANGFSSKITIVKEAENETINAKSILGVLTLCAVYNTELLIRAEGADEAEAVQALSDFFDRRFEEA